MWQNFFVCCLTCHGDDKKTKVNCIVVRRITCHGPFLKPYSPRFFLKTKSKLYNHHNQIDFLRITRLIIVCSRLSTLNLSYLFVYHELQLFTLMANTLVEYNNRMVGQNRNIFVESAQRRLLTIIYQFSVRANTTSTLFELVKRTKTIERGVVAHERNSRTFQKARVQSKPKMLNIEPNHKTNSRQNLHKFTKCRREKKEMTTIELCVFSDAFFQQRRWQKSKRLGARKGTTYNIPTE